CFAILFSLIGSHLASAAIDSNGATFFHQFATNAARGMSFVRPDEALTIPFSNRLDGIQSASVGGWFYLRRSGEQALFSRGLPECGPNGERMFPHQDKWVNFLIGTDQRGFFLGAING